MKLRLITLALPLVLLLSVRCFAAETVTEAWRSPTLAAPQPVAVNPTDNSCWVVDTVRGEVLHLSESGTMLGRSTGFSFRSQKLPQALSVNPIDGSCWVADTEHGQVVHLAENGEELWRGDGFYAVLSVAVNAHDGSCWVGDYLHNQVVLLAADGAELWRGGNVSLPILITAGAADGSCWVGTYTDVVHLASDGTELARVTGFVNVSSVSMNATDGSCWVADQNQSRVFHLGADGTQLWSGAVSGAFCVSADAADNSCWIAGLYTDCGGGHYAYRALHLAEDGSELGQEGWYLEPSSIAANPRDGSAWITDYRRGALAHVAADGSLLLRLAGFTTPESLSVNAADGSCWVADGGQVAHLSQAGSELGRAGSSGYCASLSVDAASGTCWAALQYGFGPGYDQLQQFDAGVSLVATRPGFNGPMGVAVNPTDGSYWVAQVGGAVQHYAADGTKLWEGYLPSPGPVAINTRDGSCWILGGTTSGQVWHVSSTGAELSLGGGVNNPRSVAVNSADGSCWIADTGNGRVVHLAEDGSPLWDGHHAYPVSVSVNETDGSCWVADTWSDQVVHLAADGAERWRGGGFLDPGRVAVDPRNGSCWVSDTGNGQVVHLVVTSGGQPAPTVSYSNFERGRSPLAALSSGASRTWRRVLSGDVPAHSGLYAMEAVVQGASSTGLRLDSPVEVTSSAEADLRAWVYVAERTSGDAPLFLGFALSAAGLDPVQTAERLGWEVTSDGASRWLLGGEEASDTHGLATGGWHLVEVHYVGSTHLLSLSLDGVPVGGRVAPLTEGRAPSSLLLQGYGASDGAQSRAYLDDVQVTLTGYPPMGASDRAFARLEGQEQVAEGQETGYTLTYGNGYPVLGTTSAGDPLSRTMHVGLRLPEGYALVSADPAPTSTSGRDLAWEVSLPQQQQLGQILLHLTTPTGLPEASLEGLRTWASLDPTAAAPLPADPGADDPVWGLCQDVLPQQLELEPRPDLWVKLRGPASASPGDAVAYALTVGNAGTGAAEKVIVRDVLPSEMGGGDKIVAVLASLAPGQSWTGVVKGTLQWGLPAGTLVLNRAYVPTAAAEAEIGNNEATWTATIVAAKDPNVVEVSPEGGVAPGQYLTYTLSCENTGAGTAYGVYATAELDGQLDPATLLDLGGMGTLRVDTSSRVLVWEVGTLGPGVGATTSFRVSVSASAKKARPVLGQATVYFPSVPEETPTNIVANTVAGSFWDVPWDHWALLPIEQVYESGIVSGYKIDGSYRPTNPVTRDQVAVYLARALAPGGVVPTGPVVASFTDVPTGFWAYDCIEYVKALGIVVGFKDGSCHPRENINRCQLATLLAKVLAGSDADIPAGPATPTFPDVATDFWAYEHIEYMVTNGLTGGYADGKYHPELGATRAQLAVFVARAFELPM